MRVLCCTLVYLICIKVLKTIFDHIVKAMPWNLFVNLCHFKNICTHYFKLKLNSPNQDLAYHFLFQKQLFKDYFEVANTDGHQTSRLIIWSSMLIIWLETSMQITLGVIWIVSFQDIIIWWKSGTHFWLLRNIFGELLQFTICSHHHYLSVDQFLQQLVSWIADQIRYAVFYK